MPRVKRGTMTHKRHKKILEQASGYWGGRSRLFKTAKEAVHHAGQYEFRDRRNRKREFRRLWITRISAGCRELGMPYSRFMEGLTKANVVIDRKMLSELAIHDSEAFSKLVDHAKAHATG